VNVAFNCPGCGHPGQWSQPALHIWHCSECDRRLQPVLATEAGPYTCAVCGGTELYRKKAFPHWLGMLLLLVACTGFLIAHSMYMQWLAWGILLGSAMIDGLLYLAVGDVVVCYRCDAQHRGVPAGPSIESYELGIGERFRQEKQRREQMHAEKHHST